MNQPETEQWLTSIDVTWTYQPDVDLAAIDEKASLRNQARIDPLDDDAVERYAADMARGDVFPPIICRLKSNRLVVLSGNHRYHAAKRTKTRLDGYIIECTDEQALRVAYEDNRRHGLPPSAAERCRQAQHLVALGWPQAAAARVVGITENRLQRAIAADEFTRRCQRLEILPVPDLPDSSKARIMGLRADPVFIDAVDLAADAALSTEEVYRLVTTCNKARSEADARDHIRNERALAADRIARRCTDGRAKNGGAQNHNPRERLVRSLTDICLLDPHAVERATLPDQRRALFEQLRRAMTHLASIDTELRR